MGDDLTQFVEFYGLPGSGKSSISHLVAEDLRKQGYSVLEPTYCVDHQYSPFFRKLIKIIRTIEFAIKYPKSFSQLKRIVRMNGCYGMAMFSQIANISLKIVSYYNQKYKYVVFDEGIVQSSISLSCGRFRSEENVKTLFDLCGCPRVKTIYIRVKPHVALLRMASRTEHDSSIERLHNDEERMKALRAFEIQCNRIDANFISRELDLEDAVADISSYLKER